MADINGKFHHVGYLVKNIDKSEETFMALGFSVSKEKVFDDIRKAYISFMSGNGTVVELIEPTEESDIYPLLKKYTNAPYHMCYTVDSIPTAIEELKAKGYLLFKATEKAPAISEYSEVAFLIHNRIGMIELLQENVQ